MKSHLSSRAMTWSSRKIWRFPSNREFIFQASGECVSKISSPPPQRALSHGTRCHVSSARSASGQGALLMLSGRSDIGGELARKLCPGREVVIAARGTHGMDNLSHKLEALGATKVHQIDFDAAAIDSHREVVNHARQLAGEI